MSDADTDAPAAFVAPCEIEGASIDPDEILVVRRGPGANCSSIGSVLDVLFLSATFGGALLVAVAAAIGDRRERAPEDRDASPDPEEEDADAGAR